MTLPGIPENIPPLLDQVGRNGTWRVTEGTSPGLYFMAWDGSPDGPFDRLNAQVHDHGIWQPGPGQSMTWLPNDPESEDTPT